MNEEQGDKISVGTIFSELKRQRLHQTSTSTFAVCWVLFVFGFYVLEDQLTFSSKLNSLSDTTGEVGLGFMKSLKLLDLCKVSCKATNMRTAQVSKKQGSVSERHRH